MPVDLYLLHAMRWQSCHLLAPFPYFNPPSQQTSLNTCISPWFCVCTCQRYPTAKGLFTAGFSWSNKLRKESSKGKSIELLITKVQSDIKQTCKYPKLDSDAMIFNRVNAKYDHDRLEPALSHVLQYYKASSTSACFHFLICLYLHNLQSV